MVDQDTTIVIVGATGDLAQRKLVPALFNLDCKGHLPDSLRIVGFSRPSRSDGQFREFMEPPTAGDRESLRSRKFDVLRSIRRMGPPAAAKHTIRGQYRGYLSEPGVPEGSSTATYTALRLYVDNWRWEGVPFYLRSGKSLAEKVTEITIQFRYPPQVLSSLGECQDLSPNVLGMCLQPDEGIHLRLEAKQPDEGM